MYEDVRTSGMAAMELHQIEPGYVVLSALSGSFPEPFAFFFFISFLTNLLIILALRDYSVCFWLSSRCDILTFSILQHLQPGQAVRRHEHRLFAHRALVERKMLTYFLFEASPPFSRLGAGDDPRVLHRAASGLVAGHLSRFCRRTAVFPILRLGGESAFCRTVRNAYSAYEEMMKNSETGINMLRVAVTGAPVLLSYCSGVDCGRSIPPPTWSAICP
jgi:hypothetical protein